MSGSAVFSYELSGSGQSIVLSWLITSDGSGDVSSPTLTQSGDTTFCGPNSPFTGTIIRADLIPGTSTVEPTDAYDVELRSQSDSTIDFLGGMGDNCPQATTKWGCPVDEVNGIAIQLAQDKLVPFAAHVGVSKQFTLKVLLALE